MTIAPAKRVLWLLVFAVTTAAAGVALAQPQEGVSAKLTPRLQDLLRQEMVSIKEASQGILTALMSGDDRRVATLAQQIHDSFILRRSMTAQDKEHLMAVAPENFVRMDRAFHELSAQLAEAAGAGNRALQHRLFGQMIEACSACHAKYAPDRFPAFAE